MATIRCDIFCTVIDNLGDAGVCSRLARQLAGEHGWQVRLWIDDPGPLALLAPQDNTVDVMCWDSDSTSAEPADVIIEAFACNLPPPYVQAMAKQLQPPVWLNLEYLSAEDWIAGCHGLPSPQAGLKKYFFFPGFVPGTGGLIRECNFAVLPAPTFSGSLEISLFCYDNPQLPALLAAWRDGTVRIVCHVADGLPRAQVESWLDTPFVPGATTTRGALTLAALRFLPQDDYDCLLARCHLNFVRGEDSFVRAQWAERPFVWQAYRQADKFHLRKLTAFLDLYTQQIGPGSKALRNFWLAWNGEGPLDWQEFSSILPGLAAAGSSWAKQIGTHGDLAGNLVKFCASRL